MYPFGVIARIQMGSPMSERVRIWNVSGELDSRIDTGFVGERRRVLRKQVVFPSLRHIIVITMSTCIKYFHIR